MKKNYILSGILIATLLMFCNFFVNAQNSRDCALFEDFENMSQNAAYLGKVVATPAGNWWIVGYSTMDANDRFLDTKSIRLRANNNDTALIITGENTRGANVIEMQFDMTDGIGEVSFYYGSYSSHSGGKVFVEYSTNGGATWLSPDNNSVTAPTWASVGEMQQFNVTVNISGNVRMRIIKYKQSGTSNSVNIDNICVTSYGGSPNTVSTPAISPNGGSFFTSQTVTIFCATEGATTRYTTNGSEPTENSTLYTDPITISTTTTLKAKAWKTGMTESATKTATFTFPAPVANIAAFKAATTGALYKITGDVTFVYRTGRNIFIKDETAGLMIYDNATPVITSTYNNGDIISGGIIGTHGIFNELYQLVPSINTAAGTPGTTVLPKVVTMVELLANFATYESQLLIIESVTFDAGTFGTGAAGNINIHQGSDVMICRNHFGNITGYETDPSKPYHVAGFAIPYNADKEICPRYEDDIFLPGSVVEPPLFSPAGGNYSEPVTVTITCITAGAKIYYTTDGTEPKETSTLFTTAFTITETTTVKTRAFHTDLNPSVIVSTTYKFPNPDQVAVPTFTPEGGSFTSVVIVTINCTTEGAEIFYTLNGNTPTEQDILYNNPIEIAEGTTVMKAKAFKSGMEPSEVASATYSVQVGIHECDDYINVFPNPTTGELRIKSEELRVDGVEIYDMFGKKQSFNLQVISSSHHLINISHLSSGVYFIRLTTEKGDVFKKISKN
ncbi:MAG: chitobiase/beta-hexosaminidase C-terminal domain-containing protein [Bacteroidales bacterium]|jgi:hypothetical protein|nr:chitobiase/beta-hexosaminidase C-terminal domain-containing protein [Bacteroidales bacterium]